MVTFSLTDAEETNFVWQTDLLTLLLVTRMSCPSESIPSSFLDPHAEILGLGQGYCVRESIAHRSGKINVMVTVAADPSLGTRIA